VGTEDRRLPTLEEFFLAHGFLTHQPRVIQPFHKKIFRHVAMWVEGRLPNGRRNLAICIPPRHGKTYIARDLVAWGLMCFPDSEWIYTSYSATLAIAQTLAIKECCASDWYRTAAPYVGVASGKDKQNYFRTTAGGAVYGVGTEGSLTGFGAGRKRREFGGGIVIDDPLVAMDALTIRREKCNTWYSQALYSRRNSAHTPVLLIMQRLHEMDLVGHVLSVEKDLWHVLSIPVMDDAGQMLWPETFSEENARQMQEIDPFAFSAQYMQDPTPAGGAMFKREHFQRYDAAPALTAVGIFADTAMKDGERNDFSVLLYAGTDGKDIYIMDVDRGKWTAPALLEHAQAFWSRHQPHRISNPVRFTGFHIEDKASGTGLIQTLKAQTSIPVIAVQRSRDKVSRANDVLPYVASGRVYIPNHAPWADALLAEMTSFSPAMTHLHDDQVDTVVDAIDTLLMPGGGMLAGVDWS